MTPVRIAGGGITGLSAAWRLRSLGIPFELFEASGRVGGVIRTRAAEGFLIESGPNTILETCREVTDLIRDVGTFRQELTDGGDLAISGVLVTRADRTLVSKQVEAEVRSYLQMALRCQGYSVELAQDGEEALRLLRTLHGQVGAVLLDVIMPRMIGNDVAASSWGRVLHADGRHCSLAKAHSIGDRCPGRPSIG